MIAYNPSGPDMRLVFIATLLFNVHTASAQSTSSITESEVTRIEMTLSADNMQGRKVYTGGIEKAANFIIHEFKAAGLKPLPGTNDYRQRFTLADPLSVNISCTLDQRPLEKQNIFAFSSDSSVIITEQAHYKKVFVRTGENFITAVYKYLDAGDNALILVDSSFSSQFKSLASLHMPQFVGSGNRVFILSNSDPKRFSIHISQLKKIQHLTNVVGILSGKSKSSEYVIFSAHYDHLGMGAPDANGDSVYNGANDDASGTTAVITLAKYFSRLGNNQRTIIFAAFTAEEIGEFGSAYFAKKINPSKISAMLNIEMIGTGSKWGNNSAFITGYEKSNLGSMLDRNLIKSGFRFYPDPYPEQNLFLRSDNASLAKKGVPAHTISTSKMDSEKYYHQRGDEFSTLDMHNMTEIIRAIALSAGSIIKGKDTPQRVVPE